MTKALVIESGTDWKLVNNNSHGNTVRSIFLSNVDGDWSCDVRTVNFDNGLSATTLFQNVQDSDYVLIICSLITSIYITKVFGQIAKELGIPVFMPSANSGTQNEYTYNRDRVIHVGALDSGFSRRADCYSINDSLTSFTTPFVAAKYANLYNIGYNNLIKTVQGNAPDYPIWDNQHGFGIITDNVEELISVPIYPIGVLATKGANNTASFYFIDDFLEYPLKVYKNGVLDKTINIEDTSIANNWFTSYDSKLVTLDFDGIGGTYELELRSANQDFSIGYNVYSLSGFNEDLPPEPEPEPDPTPPYIPSFQPTFPKTFIKFM